MDATTGESELRRLMVAGLEGDAAAYRALLSALATRLRGYFKTRLARIGRGPVEAEDLVQEVLMAVHTRRDMYDVSQPLTPWVYGIAHYKFLNHLRRTKASIKDVPIDEAADLGADDAEAVESALDLDKLLGALPAKTRRAIECVKLEGLSADEAAARTGLSASAVKVRVHRGLKVLASLISKGGRP